ncbi:MAG: alpha/beta fold hydrolase [Acidimicrobiales bacterium]|jgi:pimeloyl-ACP methyl ester carboxylesterase
MTPRLASVPRIENGDFSYHGIRLAYEVHGTGPRLLVYLHGLLLDENLNRHLAVSLAQAGNRVVLFDLPGHGKSDKPRHAAFHRMDNYADCVIALLDHLGEASAVIGGVSLGANVALECAAIAPDRVRGLLIEMPVLEWAVPGAGLVFLPLLLGVHYAARFFRLLGDITRSLPHTSSWIIEGLRAPLSLRPEESAAILHGLFVGPIAPTVEQRKSMSAPTLVIGHHADFIHPFSDAANLVEQMPNARLIQAHSIVELRVRPDRLTGEITRFLDEVWGVSYARDYQARSR